LVAGDFAVEITDEHGCRDTSACYAVSTNVGIAENDFGPNFTIYPTPTKEDVTVDLGKEYQNLTVTVRDVLGKTMSITSFKSVEQTVV